MSTVMNNSHNDDEVIAVLDAGSQYGKVIDRRFRELNVRTIFYPLEVSRDKLLLSNVKGIVISGGPGSVRTADSDHFDHQIFSLGVPVLGICYGMQLIASCFGGKVDKTDVREDGQYSVEIDPKCCLFEGLSESQTVLLTHGDTCTDFGSRLAVTGKCDDVIVGLSLESMRIYGVQFHPEVDLTPNGKTIFKNFVKICNIKPCFTLQSRLKETINQLQADIGTKSVVCFVSGGVDSAVCAVMLQKAIGKERVIPVHIDSGFMRSEESSVVEKSLQEVGVTLLSFNESITFSAATTKIPMRIGHHVNYRQSNNLNRTVNPEEKRKIIGDTFIAVYNSILAQKSLSPDSTLLAQGTLRPDLIESGSSYASAGADAIKTHHNDTDLVRKLRSEGLVLEPLKDFHKDEVRQLGSELRINPSILQRQPFPGPGLAIRILCADQPYMAPDFCETQTILKHMVTYNASKARPYHLFNKIANSLSDSEINMLDKITLYGKYTATLLPIQTVGVQGDARTYSYCVTLSTNDVTVNWEHLFFFAKVLPRCCHNINRVTFAFGPEINFPVNEVTQTYLEKPVVELLRQCDNIATSILRRENCLQKISQMPVVLIPIHFDRDPVKREPSTKRSVVLRTFITNDFMTGVPAIPNKDIPESALQSVVATVSRVPGVSRILFDLTPKPPGTTEWE